MANKFMIIGLVGAILLTIGIIETSDLTFAQASITQPEIGTTYDRIKPGETVQPAIYLRSRVIIPGVGIEPETRKRLEALPQDRIHVLLYLDHIPTQIEREQLQKNGITLLSYIHNNGWLASVPKDRLEEVANARPVRWVGEILPEDKLGSTVKTQKFGKWSYDPISNTVDLTVFIFKDISLDRGVKIVSRYGASLIGEAPPINAIVVKVPVTAIPSLLAEDAIQWIEEVEPPGTDDNDQLREAINVDTVQAPPYNLTGTNVSIAHFETGVPDSTHPDLSGRVTIPSGGSTSTHATHVAGTVLGNGSLSATNSGSSLQWRGVAVNATEVAYVRSATVAGMTTDYNTSINTYGVDISTNSWGSSYAVYSNYTAMSEFYDAVVGGNLTRPISIVGSAGNKGRNATDGVGNENITADGYLTVRVPNGAKNTIVVASVGSDDLTRSAFSSKGPTADGRLKPDVTAPGCQNNSYYETVRAAGNRDLAIGNVNNSIWSTYPGTSVNYPYYGDCGTSMSTPAVTGSLALMLESYRQNHENDPLPSTLKAVLIHTALDLDRSGNGSATNDGPDFVNGWGLINATKAVDLIMNDTEEAPRIVENVINQGETDYYNITVPANTMELKVTIVWDDVPGVPNDGLKELQNDLDLYLVDPLGGVHYPWLLDPTNYTEAATTGVDDLNNVEQVWLFDAAGLQAGSWQAVVNGFEIPEPDQSYSLVASFGFTTPVHAVILLMDTSGSMGWDPYGNTGVPENETRLYMAKQASYYFLDLLNLYQTDNTTFGVATFPDHPWTSCAAATGEVVSELTTLDNTTKDAAAIAIDALTASGGTPMAGGIEVARTMLQLDAADRDIVLLSDGYHNCPNTSFPLSSVVNDTSIKIHTIAYGNVTQVNHALLEEISNASGAGGEGEGFYVAENTTLTDLVPIFKAIIVDVLGLYSPIDPPVTIMAGQVNQHPIAITEHDDKVTFSLSWGKANSASSLQPPLQLKLMTPGGTTIDPATASGTSDIEYISKDTYQLYFVKGSHREVGAWQMLVDANNLQQGTEAVYHYSVIAKSDLQMDVSFDETSYETGDGIFIKVNMKERGSPTSPSKLVVKVKSPAEGLGNWYATNRVTDSQLKKIPKIKDGEVLPGVYRKATALTDILKVPVPSSVIDTTIELYDDGAHGDGAAGDGIYANYFKDTVKEGTYTFTIRSKGTTRNNNHYTREKIVKRYVAVKVDPGSTKVKADLDKKLKGSYAKYRITVVPMDALGNYLGPGHSRSISFDTKDARLVGPLVDNLDGSYVQYVKVDTAKTETIGINIKGVEVKQEIKPERPPFPVQWLILLLIIILAIIIFVYWKSKT